jgi:hypothetical protein
LTHLFQFDFVHRVLRCIVTGPVTYPGLRESCRAVALYVRRADATAVILDFTAAKSDRNLLGTVRSLGALEFGSQGRSIQQFIVAASDALYGFARMYQVLTERTCPRLQVVRSLAEAYAAMNIEGSNFEPLPDDWQQDL